MSSWMDDIRRARECAMAAQNKTALSTQVGGSHYKNKPIQPIEYCHKNGLGPCESAIVKYATRHKEKGRAEDVRKIIHYAQLLLELEYGEQ